MRDVLLLIVGVLIGGAVNLAVQMIVRHSDRRHASRIAARVVHDELMEWGYLEINTTHGPQDASRLHAVWREHRADLVGIGGEAWRAVEDVIFDAVYPETAIPRPAESHNSKLEKALWFLEPHAGLPSDLRGFS